MNKKIILIGLLSLLFFTGCSNNSNLSNKSETSICTESILNSIDELASCMIQGKDSDYKKAFEHPTQKMNSSKLTIYTLQDIPEDYELSEIRTSDYSDFIAMDYLKNSEETCSKITFVWGFNINGDEGLNDAIGMIGLSPMPGMPGFYYIEAMDDNEEYIYQIYWTKDGYLFQVNIPAYFFGNTENTDTAMLTGEETTNEYIMNIAVEKTEYSLDAE